jgi:hypothetical protein
MELIMMSLGGSLIALTLQLSEIVVGVAKRLRNLSLESTVGADPELVIPGF